MNELPNHLKYRPCPEIVRAHEQWQSGIRQAVSQLQSMGHVRAPEAIGNICMPLFGHLDALFTLLQADLSAYAEQVMTLSQEGQNDQVIVGMHPQDAETLADLTDQIFTTVEKVAKGHKEGTTQREQLDDALKMISDLQEGILTAALEEDEVPDEDEVDLSAPAAEPAPAAPAAAAEEGDLSDEPLQIA